MSSKAHSLEDKLRTKDVLIEEQLNFNALLLSEQTLTGLHSSGFQVPSPIQLKAIPIGKCGFDLIVKSKSGTGKTVVFSIIALESINTKKNSVQVLILTPTREIAVQIQDVLKSLGSEFKDLKVESFIGGLPVDEDIKKLNKCHIAVGAPGRIKHLLHMGSLKPDQIKLFVLDEADKLIDSDMQVDIDYISKKLPSAKQVISSSATYSDEVITYLDNLMSSPTLVEPNTDSPLLLGLKQFVTVVKSNLNVIHQLNIKNEELIRLFSQITFSQCLVFTNYQSRAESISNTLNRNGWNSMYMSAAQNQVERLKVMNMLQEGKCRILLSTDITARGIDAANVDLVINYDVPYEASTYLHRMGRAGRFGSHGICITIAAHGKDLNEYQKILGAIGGTNVFIQQLPKNGNLPSDLWNADISSFELIQGVIDDSIKFISKTEIASSLADLKMQRNSLKQKKSEINDRANQECETNEDLKNTDEDVEVQIDEGTINLISHIQIFEKGEKIETLNQNLDTNMPDAIETLLNNNKKREENLKATVAAVDAFSLLKDLATDNEVSKLETHEVNMFSEQSPLDDVLTDTSNSKKRKRKSQNMLSKEETSNDTNQNKQLEKNQIMCKNLALLNAARLLCEPYDPKPIAEDVVSSFYSYLKSTNEENSFKNVLATYSKENILNSIANGEIENLLYELNHSQSEVTVLEDVIKTPSGDLEDIFKLSYDYAVNSGKAHWLDVLGQELEEKMSLTDKVPEDDPQSSFSEMRDPLLELPKRRRKRKTNKKKVFKDFTQKNKNNNGNPVNDQSMDTYGNQEVKETANEVDPNYYYQAGLYSEYEYGNNEHFTTCFDYYSTELTQRLQTFEDMQSFETWFADWQWQVQGVRDFVQQNIYLQEMNKYALNKHS